MRRPPLTPHQAAELSKCLATPLPTPGPWEASEHGTCIIAKFLYGRGNLASVHTNIADAKLLAAAPELLNALTQLANYFEVHTADTGRTTRGEEVWQMAKAAIAKAKV